MLINEKKNSKIKHSCLSNRDSKWWYNDILQTISVVKRQYQRR